MLFPKNTSAAEARAANAGDVFVHQGHRASCTSPFTRAYKRFETKMGYVVLSDLKHTPIPVTIIHVLGDVERL